MGDLLSMLQAQNGSLEDEPDSTPDAAANGCSPAALDPAAFPSELQWQRSDQQMDRTALMARDPILYYDEVPLYESELDDNGASQLSVKVGGSANGIMV